ncbi:MAG TPA: ABC transporter permease subunit [archaeon]|nr:ABC transporter permease subunit [archaeon]
MILSIALKEFYNNLVSARFTIGFLLCLFLVPFALFVSINDYKGQVRAYETERKQAEESAKVRVYSALRPEIVKPPEPLSIFSRGVSYNVGSEVKVLLGEKPFLSTGRSAVRENPFFNSFFSLDFVSILAAIISLLALLFTYDSCSGEREQGTLKLMLSNSVGRYKILLGKVIGVCLALLPVVLFCYLLGALVILFSPDVSFSPGEWVRICVLFALSVLFFGLFMLVGLFISTRFRSSAVSIVVCLFVWVVFVFIVPNLSVYMARSLIKVSSQESLRSALSDLDREYGEKCKGYRTNLAQPDVWMHWNYTVRYDGFQELYGSSRSLMEFYRQLNQFSEPLRIDYADKKWAFQKAYLESLDRQRTFAENLALISPSEVFRLAASALCRTDAESHYRFLERTRSYRDEFISFLNNKKIFSSFEYFTRQPQETFMTGDEIIKTRTGGEFETMREFGKWSQAHNGDFSPLWRVDIPGTSPNEYQPLDLSQMPKFRWEQASIWGSLKNSLGKVAVMAGVLIVLFYLSFISFIRYDVR